MSRTYNRKRIFLITSILLVIILYLYIFQYEEKILEQTIPTKMVIDDYYSNKNSVIPRPPQRQQTEPKSPTKAKTMIQSQSSNLLTHIQSIKNNITKPIPAPNTPDLHQNPNKDIDHNEANDIEFKFMQIKDQHSAVGIPPGVNISVSHQQHTTPSPTAIELPDHWINPCYQSIAKNFKFCDESLSFSERATDFASHLNETELFRLTNAWAMGTDRADFVKIEFHDWWNEALHGLSVSSGVHYWPYIPYATQFPQVIAVASSYNRRLWHEIANVISTEARVYSNFNQSYLTFWSPNINIFRDPRWYTILCVFVSFFLFL